MPKRAEALMPLTHDHHHALVQVRKLRGSVKEDDAAKLAQAKAFLGFFQDDTLLHFREEEELIFPLAVHDPEAEPVLGRLMLEHLRFHAAVRALRSEIESGAVSDDTLTAIVDQLEAHIRYEEKTAFPMFERIAAADLPDVKLAPRNRTPQQTD